MTWRVKAFHGRTSSGRAQPPRVEIEADDGSRFEAYLKSPLFFANKSPHGLIREWIATRLATDLGLPCAPVVAVEVTRELIEMGKYFELGAVLAEGPSHLTASVSFGPGWYEWGASAKVGKSQVGQACAIYFFDTMIQNWDRCLPNPNLLINGLKYGLIDHDECFTQASGTVLEKEGIQQPWQEDGVSNHVGEWEAHPLWSGIKHNATSTFHPFVSQWKSLPIATIEGYASDNSLNGADCHIADRIVGYLIEAIEKIDAIHMQIEAHRTS
jgi:hypothetical protein